MVADAFRANGVEAAVLEWRYPRRNLFQEMLYYSSGGYRAALGDAQDRSNALALEEAIMASDPSCVLVIKAVELTEKVRAWRRDRDLKFVLWAYDSATEFPVIRRCAPDFDLVYTYEPADLELLSDCCSPRLLPMAYDDRFYFKSPDATRRDLDISFVGGIDLYPQRRRLLRRIAHALSGRRVGVWTDSAHWYSHRRVMDVLWFGGARNLDLRRQTLDHRSINAIYNRSRVCLNIHHAQSVRALNPRTFEILGSGGLLVTDRKLDHVEGFEDGGGYVHYSGEDELVEKLEALFQDDDEAWRISELGHSRVRRHTYVNRAKAILEALR